MKTLLLLSVLSVAVLANDEARVFRYDPVALMAGEEIIGQASHAIEYGGTTYLFRDEANRETFSRAPERYAIRLGGACARMGPLSGRGNLSLFTVHDQKLYVFGSEGCRTLFSEDPAKTFDPDQPPPAEGDPAEGERWLEKLVTALGGSDRLENIARYEEIHDTGEGDYQKNRIDFPDRYHHSWQRGERRFERTLEGNLGWFDGFEGNWAMAPVQVRAMKRERLSQPLYLLRMLDEPGFVVRMQGREQVGEREAARVAVFADGLNQTLLIDRETGRLLVQRFRGRGPRALFGSLERRFSGYRAIGGLTLPTVVETRFEGQPWKTETWRITVN